MPEATNCNLKKRFKFIWVYFFAPLLKCRDQKMIKLNYLLRRYFFRSQGYNIILQMINDKFIFTDNAKSQGNTTRVVKTQVTTNHIATKNIKRTLDQSTQGDELQKIDQCVQNELAQYDHEQLALLSENIEKHQKRIQELEMTVAPIDELDIMQFDFDRQMLTLQSKLDTLSTLVDFERNIDFATATDEQPSVMKQQQAPTSMTFFDPDDIHNLTRLPIKCADLSSLVEKYENEQHYLESLNLRKVVTEVFKTLEKSLVKVNEYLGQIDTVRTGAYDFNYDFVQQVTQQRDYLDGFTSKFMRLINQVLTLNDYIKQKEKIHLTQIESLASQNQALFDENCTLQRQLLLRQQQSDASLYPPQQTQSQEQLRTMTLKEQKRLVKEVCRLHSQKIEAIKASLQSSSVSQIEQPLPKLQSLPLEDPKIYTLINDNLNMLSQLQEIVKQKVDTVQAENTKCKERMTQIMGNYQVFKRTFDDVNSTLIPKCRSLLAIDAEQIEYTREYIICVIYIRSTILNNRDMMDQAIHSKQSKQLPDSISSLNVMKVHEAILQKIDHLLIQLK